MDYSLSNLNPLKSVPTFRNPFKSISQSVEKAASKPMAIGSAAITETSLKDAIGHSPDYDFTIIYGLYRFNSDISASVHKWAGGIVSPKWRLKLMDDDATPTDKQLKQMKETGTWLKRPNPNKGMTSLLYTVVQHLAICGDAFWYVSRDAKGMPLEIWPMHPALTRIVATKEGEVLGYVMHGPGGDKVTFKPEEVVHFQLPNPESDIYGEGRVELVVEEAGIDLQALRSNKAIFINGLSPSALLLLDDKATQEDARQLTETIRQSHSGSDKRHKILALSRVQDFKPYSMTLKDMEFLGLRNLSTDKVTAVMGVPKVLLGNHNSGDYATTKFLVREMHQNVFMPVQDIISEAITEHLIHSINPDFAWELNDPDSSDPDILRKDQMAAKQAGILTVDEVRQDSFSKDPLEEDIEDKKPVTDTDGKSPGELDEHDGDTEDAPEELEDEDTTKSLVTKAADDDIDPYAIERDQRMEDLEQELYEPISTHFTDQEADYLTHLPEDLTEESLDTYINTNKDALDAAFALLLGSLLYQPLNAGVIAAKQQMYETSGDTPEGKLKIDLSLRFDQVNPVVQRYIQNDAFAHVQGINHTTREQLRATLAEAMRKGENVTQISDRIAAVFESARNYRTTMIARTETAQAFAYANYEALNLLYKDGLVKYRKWLTAPEDGRTCLICQPLNGYTIRFDAKYPDELEPAHVHPQCRCTEIGLLGDEEE